MKRILFVGFFFLYTIIRPEMTFPYEVDTHEDMSQKALEASVLASPSSVLNDLQLKGFSEDSQQFPDAGGKPRNIRDLVRYGANQEDNLYIPAVGGSRFMHHFYDPVHNIPLTDFTPFDLEFVRLRYGVPYRPIQKSPTWALEDNGDFLDNKYTGQIFSYKDARGYFFKALTEFSKTERDKYFGLTFQTLGHVLHHIQDMAQPQHVKNEQHPPINSSGLYEHYTNLENVRTRLPFAGYSPVDSLVTDQKTFDTPRKFWTTNNGKGLAEFTNFNFVTYGHNFVGTLAQPKPNPVYPNPAPIAFGNRTVIDLPLAPQLGLNQTALDGKMYFIKAPVADVYRPSEAQINNLASAFSLYDDDLTRWNIHLDCPPGSVVDPSVQCTQQAVFTVNRFTMSTAHDFLIPRAVGYSAGMINYFFRGKLSVDSQTQPGRLIVKNESPETLSGHFTLYYDDVEDHRYAVVPDSANSIGATPWPTPTEGLLPGQTLTLPTFSPPPTGLRPAPKTFGEYMLVFQGDIGAEIGTAVAAKLVNDDGCPTEFMTPTGRLSHINSAWNFTADPTVQYGNTDWVGRDCTRLSWLGPYGRHVHMRHTSALSNKIFSAGQVFATAPGPVLGAAIQTNPFTDERILLAVVAEVPEGGIVLPGSPDTSGQVSADKLYGLLLNNPTAWFLLSTFDQYTTDYESNLPAQTAYPAHYFFNASGTQAVSVKRIAGEEEDTSPWRVLMLDVTAHTGAAEFTLGAVETIGTPQESNTGTDSSNGATSYSYRNTYDLSYTAPAVTADYQGNQLVTVMLHVEEHSVEAGSGSGNPDTGSSSTYTHHTTRQWTLETNTGWTHTVIDDTSTTHNSSVVDGPATCECGSHRSERHTDKMQHGLVYVDLRFQPPVLAYEVFQGDYDTILESDTPLGGPVQIVQDLDTVQEKEQLIWLIADQEESVTGLRTITLEAPAKFVLPNQAPVAFAEGGREVGTFVAGGSLQHPRVVAAHKYSDFDNNGQLEFGFASNFIFPTGDLNAYGGGPVGY